MTEEAKGVTLSNALSASVTQREAERTIYVQVSPGLAPEVTLVGDWDGRLLLGAIKAIERQYKLRKLTARRQSLANRKSGGE